MKDKKNILICALLLTIMVMAVGYAAFRQTLNIDGTATIAGEWQVEITGVTPSVTGTAQDMAYDETDNPNGTRFTATTATFDAKLMKPGDSITYTITVKNNGSIDAKLSTITLTPQADGSDAIIYEVVSQPAADSVLAAGESTTVQIRITYDADTEEIPEVTTKTFTGVLEYVQAA